MATDTVERRSPLGALAGDMQCACSGARFSCREDPFRVLTEIRCAPAWVHLAAGVVGGDPPSTGTLFTREGSFVIGLGPQWWMSDAPEGSMPLRGTAQVSAVEVSAQRTTLLLGGTAVRDVLAHGCSIDLHPLHFQPGSAVQTLLAKARVILARTGSDEYRLWVQASFARYVAVWLMDASVEYR